MKWLFVQLLALYPHAHRQDYGAAMLQTFADAEQAAKNSGELWAFYRHTFVDTFKDILVVSHNLAAPDKLARAAAVLAAVLALMYLVAAFGVQFRGGTVVANIHNAVVFGFFLLAFLSAQRRSFAEWLYLGITCIGTVLGLVGGFYLYTSDWYNQNPPPLYGVIFNLIQVVGWLTPAALVVALILRSREQRRVSRMFLYVLLHTVFLWGFDRVSPPAPLESGLSWFWMLWTASCGLGCIAYAILALKFWQRPMVKTSVVLPA